MTSPLLVFMVKISRKRFERRFYLLDEEFDHFLRPGARLAAADPAVLAQRELLALQHKLGVALQRDKSPVGAVVLEHPLVAAPLDGAVAARGHVVGDRDAALGVAAEVDGVVVAPARDFLVV